MNTQPTPEQVAEARAFLTREDVLDGLVRAGMRDIAKALRHVAPLLAARDAALAEARTERDQAQRYHDLEAQSHRDSADRWLAKTARIEAERDAAKKQKHDAADEAQRIILQLEKEKAALTKRIAAVMALTVSDIIKAFADAERAVVGDAVVPWHSKIDVARIEGILTLIRSRATEGAEDALVALKEVGR